MKTLAFNINIHRYFLLKKYRFFDIGNDNYYFDDYTTRAMLQQSESNCLRPALEMLLALVRRYKKRLRFSVGVSGPALQMLEESCSDSLRLLQQLAATGCVEFTAQPYNYSLAGINDMDEFRRQVTLCVSEIKRLFNQEPLTFQNTGLIYTDDIGKAVYDIGFKLVLVQSEKRSLDVKGTDYLYFHPSVQRLRILPLNVEYTELFEDVLKDKNLISAEGLVEQVGQNAAGGDVMFTYINIDYLDSTKYNNREVLSFVKTAIEKVLSERTFKFDTPSSVLQKCQPISPYKLPAPVPGLNFTPNLYPWLGNELQREAFSKINALKDKVRIAGNATLQSIWQRLQCSDYLYFMSDSYFNHDAQRLLPNPFDSPYNAFIAFMNIVGDFERRVDISVESSDTEMLSNKQIADAIKYYQAKVKELKKEYQKRSMMV